MSADADFDRAEALALRCGLAVSRSTADKRLRVYVVMWTWGDRPARTFGRSDEALAFVEGVFAGDDRRFRSEATCLTCGHRRNVHDSSRQIVGCSFVKPGFDSPCSCCEFKETA